MATAVVWRMRACFLHSACLDMPRSRWHRGFVAAARSQSVLWFLQTSFTERCFSDPPPIKRRHSKNVGKQKDDDEKRILLLWSLMVNAELTQYKCLKTVRKTHWNFSFLLSISLPSYSLRWCTMVLGKDRAYFLQTEPKMTAWCWWQCSRMKRFAKRLFSQHHLCS